MPPRIDALLFDLGRVLIDIDMTRAHARWAAHAGVGPETFDAAHTAALMSHPAFHRHERGQIADAEFFAMIRAETGLALSDAHLLDGWNAIFVGEVAGIRDVLARVARRLPCYGFSNTNAAHQAYWSVHYAELLAPLRKMYVSNALGHRKPDAEAFAAVTADMRVAADRVLFFDDSPANVAGARASGLQAVLVGSVADIAAGLEAHGV